MTAGPSATARPITREELLELLPPGTPLTLVGWAAGRHTGRRHQHRTVGAATRTGLLAYRGRRNPGEAIDRRYWAFRDDDRYFRTADGVVLQGPAYSVTYRFGHIPPPSTEA